MFAEEWCLRKRLSETSEGESGSGEDGNEDVKNHKRKRQLYAWATRWILKNRKHKYSTISVLKTMYENRKAVPIGIFQLLEFRDNFPFCVDETNEVATQKRIELL